MTRQDSDNQDLDHATRVSIAEVLDRHLPALRAFVRLRTNAAIRQRESESDIVQSVCRELLQERSQFDFRGEGAFRSWLYTAALRKVVEKDRYYRAQKRDIKREVRIGGSPTEGDLQPIADCYSVLATASQDLAAKEQMECIDRAFARLEPDYQRVLSLGRVAALPLEDVAREMGRSKDACRKLIRRAQVQLALLLESQQGAPSGHDDAT